MLTVEWLDSALDDLHHIIEFIAKRNTQAAIKLATQLVEDSESLSKLPLRYRRGRVAGTYELVSHPNYIIVYRYSRNVVEILNVLHSRQTYPK